VNETLDELLRGRIKVYQPRRGARVTLDPLLLADFAGTRARRVVDLGCGVGVVAIAILSAAPHATAVGVELQPELAELARKNAALNGLEDRLRVVEGDLRRRGLVDGSADLVVANPPYFDTSRPAPARDRALSRQEIAATLGDVLEAARRLLAPRGRVAVILPASRLVELVSGLAARKLAPTELRFVHSVAGEPARRVLARAVAGGRGAPVILPPLVVHEDDRRSYTPEARRILGEPCST
jgi:tRNA1Val (adenine37-N6)-methyltransferase